MGSRPIRRFEVIVAEIRTRTGLRVGKAGKLGRGVFATKAFAKGDLIEVAPLLVFETGDSVLIDRTDLHRYTYSYDKSFWCAHERCCLALGYASLYNHSTRPNAVYELFEDHIEIRALRTIKNGTQIRINYNGDPEDKTPWDFDEEGQK